MKRVLCLLLASLLVLPLGARRLRVAFVGDPQVDNEKELSYARRSIYDELRGRSDLDMAIFLGDLVNDDVSLLAPIRWKSFASMLSVVLSRPETTPASFSLRPVA